VKVRPFDPAAAVVFSHTLLDTTMPVRDPYEWRIVCAVLRHPQERRLSVGTFTRWTSLANRPARFELLTRRPKKGYIGHGPVDNSFACRPILDLELPGFGE
jgi:hypothetical protein